MRAMKSIRNPIGPDAGAEAIVISPVKLFCHKRVFGHRDHRLIDLSAMLNGQFLEIFACAWFYYDAKRHSVCYSDPRRRILL